MTIELGPLIMGALGGIGSWFLTQGVTEPLRRFSEMRRDIIEHLLDTLNVPATHDATTGEPTKRNVSDQDLARLREAERKCRQLGTKLLSFYQTDFVAEHLLRWCWRYDVLKAGRALIGLSNNLSLYGAARKEHRQDIHTALGIKDLVP
jgi:hypothetical protein